MVLLSTRQQPLVDVAVVATRNSLNQKCELMQIPVSLSYATYKVIL